MRSKAVFMGHPIHPILIPFPIVLFISALAADVVGRLYGNPRWWEAGAVLGIAGILFAIITAMPGFVDFLFTVPPNSSGQQRAIKHMIANLTATVLFLIAWFLRRHIANEPSNLVLLVELIGVGCLGVGGWLGGTLSYKNLIGVEHAYAGAGYWKEEAFDQKEGQAITVAKADELKVDQMKLLRVNGKRIALARTEQGYQAFDDRCAHKGASLCDGVCLCGTVQCMWHGSQFDAASGAVKSGPAKDPVKTYRVVVNGDQVQLTL